MNRRSSVALCVALFAVGALFARPAKAQTIAPPLLPVPCHCSGTAPNLTNCQREWTGTIPELYFADAMSQCSATTSGYDHFEATDQYALAILKLEGQTGSADGIPGAIWSSLRQSPSLNCDQETLAPNQTVPFPTYIVPQNIPYTGSPTSASLANNDLRAAGVNLCVAQVLRSMVSGASSGEALLFSDADQRELLEIVRERAQIAMLYYALLGETFVQPQYTGTLPPLNQQTRMRSLTNWAWSASAATLTQMGSDFAAAVQLHAYVTQEMASLLARSRSAGLPRTPAPLAPPDDQWGTGSWYQRELALFFGGDPLAINGVNTGGPPAAWTSPLANPYPGTLLMRDWLPFPQGPYVQTPLTTPLVQELLQLARRFDDLTLLSAPGAPACATGRAHGSFDATGTAASLYENVEFDLEVANCAPAAGGNCPASSPRTLRTLPTDGAADDTWLLWSMFQITPAHAQTLASYLIDAVSDPTCPADAVSYSGAFAMAGADQGGLSTLFTDSAGTHISPQAIFSPRTVEQLGPTYALNSVLRFADATEIGFYGADMDVGSYGFDGGCVFSSGKCYTQNDGGQGKQESMRTMGAMAAEAATREMLIDTERFLSFNPPAGVNTGLTQTYLQNADRMIGVLDGAVGPSVSMRAAVVAATMADGSLTLQPVTFGTNGSASVLTQYRVRVTADASDSFWDALEGNPPTAAYVMYFLPEQYASDLAIHPESMVDGQTIATAVQAATAAKLYSVATTDLSSGIAASDNLRHIDFLISFPSSGRGTLVVVKTDTTPSDSPASKTYRLVAGNIAVPTSTAVAPASPPGAPYKGSSAAPASFFGEYIATGGSLGTLMAHQAQPYDLDPSQPAYDGFDLPNHRVPPFNAALLGGDASQPSASAYLAMAQSAAASATTAVQTVFSDLQQQATDKATAQAAAVQAAASVQSDAAGLCGQANTSCDLKLVGTALNPDWYPAPPSLPDCTGLTGTDQQACQVTQTLVQWVQGVIGTLASAGSFDRFVQNPQYLIADAVLQTLPDSIISSGGAPSFASYQGGSLQQAFITQWQALQAPVDKINTLLSTLEAANNNVTAAASLLDFQTNDKNAECSPVAMSNAVEEGTSVSVTASVGLNAGLSVGMSFSEGPLLQQQQKCQELQTQMPANQAQATAAFSNAMLALASAMAGFCSVETDIQSSGAQVAALVQQARLANSQAQLEAALTTSTLTTSTGIWRVYRSSDVWRAKALLDDARQYALAARRAVEAQYVVDLSTMSQSEAFVAGPATWANDVYTYDLSMPSAVGLAVGGSTPGGVYSNQVSDYVSNLQSFVSGYTVSRPTAVDQNEIDVVTLPGFTPGAPVSTSGGSFYPGAGAWELHCPADPASGASAGWIPAPVSAGDVDAACSVGGVATKPDEVRLEFALDPWGRVNGSVTDPPEVDRYNVRWGQLALNFVGTGIKDCTKAADPQGCYASEDIPYSLTQTGPSWITDFSQVWRTLDTPTSTIEGAKGLAAEVWLDPLQDGWSTPYISAIARTEYELAPIGGSYQLDFQVPPEVVLDNIQRLQLMVGSSAWVAEQP